MDALRDIPLTDIDPHALARDRVHVDEEALHELQRSIAANGLRQPIEVFPIEGPKPFGLIAGFRRFAAVRALNALGGGFGTIAAFVRAPQSAGAAYAAMVEENEVRADLSPFERGQIALIAHERGLFGSVEAAVNGLYATASKAKRSRLRAAAQVADELGDVLVHPQALSMARVLRLSAALRQGFGPVLRAALENRDAAGAATEWAVLLPYLEEAEAELSDAKPTERATRAGRPRRMRTPRRGLSIRREVTRGGYALRFTGAEATSDLLDLIMDEIDRLLAPG